MNNPLCPAGHAPVNLDVTFFPRGPSSSLLDTATRAPTVSPTPCFAARYRRVRREGSDLHVSVPRDRADGASDQMQRGRLASSPANRPLLTRLYALPDYEECRSLSRF